MSVATPTVLPRPPLFPALVPKPPQPHPVPLPKQGRVYGRLNACRNLAREMDDLSDEENDLDEMIQLIRHRGYNFLIPIGRNLTQQEEKNDADEDTEESESEAASAGPPSAMEDDGENESAQDLDASMEDLDEDGDGDGDGSDESGEEGSEEEDERSFDV